jgi:hypothetical protein
MKISSLLTKINFLGQFIPEIYDVIPKGPLKVSPAIREYMAATLVREIAEHLDDQLKAELQGIGKRMVETASKGLIAGWEDGDDICPPFPFPWPFEPTPIPWKNKFVGLAHGLRVLAEITTLPEISKSLHTLSLTLAERHLTKGNLAEFKRLPELGPRLDKFEPDHMLIPKRIKDIVDSLGKSVIKDARDVNMQKRLKDTKDSRDIFVPKIPEWEWPMGVDVFERLDALEESVSKAEIFISRAERPNVGGNLKSGSGK